MLLPAGHVGVAVHDFADCHHAETAVEVFKGDEKRAVLAIDVPDLLLSAIVDLLPDLIAIRKPALGLALAPRIPQFQ